MDPASVTNPLYLLEHSDEACVLVDDTLQVLACNARAAAFCPGLGSTDAGRALPSIWAEPCRARLCALLDRAREVEAPDVPHSQVLNLPGRSLLLRVHRLRAPGGGGFGFLVSMHAVPGSAAVVDAADASTGADAAACLATRPAALHKIPTVAGDRIVLVDATQVRYVRAEGHYTWVHGAKGAGFCNLTIGDLQARLDAGRFMRVHRSYLANLDHATEIVRRDGRVTLRLEGDARELPVARQTVPRLLARLGIVEQLDRDD